MRRTIPPASCTALRALRLWGRGLLGLGLLAAPLLLALPGQASPTKARSWFAEKYAAGDVPVRVEYLWSKGPLFRSEAIIAGHPIVTIVRGDQYIIIDRLTRKGVSIQRSARAIAEQKGSERPFGNELTSLLAAGGEFVGTQDFAGKRCDLYRLTNGEGRREVCATQDEAKLPVLLRVWMRKSKRQVEGRYVNWVNTLDIPDSYFEPDPRIPLRPISYQQYLEHAHLDLELPAPPLYRDLLHGH